MSETGKREVRELAVVLEQVVGPDALHDLDRLAHVGVAALEQLRDAGGGELLGHPAGTDADVETTVGQVVLGREFGGEHTRRAVWRVDDAHAEPDLLRLGGQPGDQGHALEPLAPGDDGHLQWEVGHHAERVLQLPAVGRLGDDDAVQRPDGVEVELLGAGGEVFELLDGDFVSEVR